MAVLAIDTAGPNCTVALLRDERVTVRSEHLGRGHAERLFPLMDDVLAEAGSAYADVERIGATVGPGSFTGVRIGVAAARGLALALGVPAAGLDVLDVLLEEADRAGARDACAVLDARRGQIYAARGPCSSRVMTLDDLVNEFSGMAEPAFIGGAAQQTVERLGRGRVIRDAAAVDPETLVRLVAEGRGASPPVPLYLRGADAKPQAVRELRAGARKPAA